MYNENLNIKKTNEVYFITSDVLIIQYFLNLSIEQVLDEERRKKSITNYPARINSDKN